MGRPTYETGKDKIAEAEIAALWGKQFNLWPVKFDNVGNIIDFAFLRGSPAGAMVCVGEVKDRPGWKSSYETVILGWHKYRELQGYELRGVPAYFIVRLPKLGIGAIRIARNTTPTVSPAGRSDRGDPKDFELCVHLHVGLFRFLKQ